MRAEMPPGRFETISDRMHPNGNQASHRHANHSGNPVKIQKMFWVVRPLSGLRTLPGRNSSTKITIRSRESAALSIASMSKSDKAREIPVSTKVKASRWMYFHFTGPKLISCTTGPYGVGIVANFWHDCVMSFLIVDSAELSRAPSTSNPASFRESNVFASDDFWT